MNSSIGTARAVRRSATSRRPVFHVVISVNSSPPINSGNQPPCSIFNSVGAEKCEVDGEKDSGHRSMPPAAASASARVATTCRSIAVMIIVMVTAMPYAAASARRRFERR